MAVTFKSLTLAFLARNAVGHLSFVRDAIKFLNEKSIITPAQRSITISTFPVGPDGYTLEFEFRTHDVQAGKERLTAPSLFAKRMSERRITQIVLKTGIREGQLMTLIRQVMSDEPINQNNLIQVKFRSISQNKPRYFL